MKIELVSSSEGHKKNQGERLKTTVTGFLTLCFECVHSSVSEKDNFYAGEGVKWPWKESLTKHHRLSKWNIKK